MSDISSRLSGALADRYAIQREIGSGGMATVYLAEDLKHRRQVAVKIFRPDLATTLGPERFLREIKIVARLQHPHILPLLDSGDADGFLYYVMPHVEGRSLRDKLERERELPIGEAVRILRDVVDALTEAHGHGVVHRDIKPENILLRGRHALVTDFGVAKAVSEATGRQRGTTAGVALGTPAYMAPEQAAADPHLDHRVDIYGVGAVAYELLTGRTVFMGTTPQMILSAHLTETPQPVTRHRGSVPGALESVVMRCLEKRPADRWQTAEELLPRLEALTTPSGETTPADAKPVAAIARGAGWRVAGAVALASLLVAAGFSVPRLFRSEPITVTTSNIRAVTSEPGREWHPALSRDGSRVAFVANRDGRQSVVVKSTRGAVGGGELRPTQGAHDAHEWFPTWNPDGESLHFVACRTASLWQAIPAVECEQMEVGTLGGSVRTMNLPRNALMSARSPDGSRVAYMARRDSIFIHSLADGTFRSIAVTGGSLQPNHSPAWSPNGRGIAYVQGWRAALTSFQQGTSSIWIVDVDGGVPARVTGGEFIDLSPTWLDADHLLFVSNRDGPRAVYLVEVGATGSRGEPRKVPGAADAHTISFSIAGQKLAFSKATVHQNIWSYPVGRGVVSIADGARVTSDNAIIQAHDVSPDGRWIAYGSNRGGGWNLYKRPLEGGEPTPVVDSPMDAFDPRWSPDGSEIAFVAAGDGEMRVMVVSADGGTGRPVASSPLTWLPLWSSSGLHLAFGSNHSGQYETWVVSREAVGAPWGEATQITDNGCWPSDWAHDGNGVLCTVGWAAGGEALLVVSRDGEVLWRYDLPGAGLALFSVRQMFSRDGSVLYAAGRRGDGTEGVWAIPVRGGEPRLVIAYDDVERVGMRWLSVGTDRLYLTVQQAEIDIWVADVAVER